jgi:predicted transcriptional regulator
LIKNIYNSITTFIVIATLFTVLNARIQPLYPIELSGKKGEYAKGGTWKSNFLLGKTNVLIYTDPDEFSDLKQFVSDIENEKMRNNNFDLTLIVNTEATMLPTFVIRSKIKSKAKGSSTINYVLDNDKVLVDEWDLQDNSINILVLDSFNQVQYQQTGKIKPHQLKEIMEIINKSFLEQGVSTPCNGE